MATNGAPDQLYAYASERKPRYSITGDMCFKRHPTVFQRACDAAAAGDLLALQLIWVNAQFDAPTQERIYTEACRSGSLPCIHFLDAQQCARDNRLAYWMACASCGGFKLVDYFIARDGPRTARALRNYYAAYMRNFENNRYRAPECRVAAMYIDSKLNLV